MFIGSDIISPSLANKSVLGQPDCIVSCRGTGDGDKLIHACWRGGGEGAEDDGKSFGALMWKSTNTPSNVVEKLTTP